MNAKIGLSICIVCLVAAGYLVPTTASTVGGTEFVDGFDGDVIGDRDVILRDDTGDGRALYATPAAGPNGEFASIVGGDGAERLELDFAATAAGGKGINPMARSTFDGVFVLVNEFDESTAVRIEIVDAPGGSTMEIDEIRDAITFYTDTDGETELDGTDPVEIAPESATSVGLEFDPVGRDIAGTSVEFAFVFTVPDHAAIEPDGPQTANDGTTAGSGSTPDGTTDDASIGSGNARTTDGFDGDGQRVDGDNDQGATPTPSGAGTEPTTTTPDPAIGGVELDAGMRSSLSMLLVAIFLLISVVVIGRGRWQ